MKKLIPIFILVLLATSLIACKPGQVTAPTATGEKSASQLQAGLPAQESFQQTWDRLVKEAKKEGKVVVYSTAGAEAREFLVRAFGDRFGISVDYTVGTGADMSQKLFAERRAGLNVVDVYIGGLTTVITSFKPAGVLGPLEPQLLLPELTNPEIIKKTWWGGELLWVEKDRTVLQFFAYPMFPITINTQLARATEFTSYRDLLNPKWKNKIALHDPTVTGSGAKLVSALAAHFMNWDFIRDLARQEPTIIRDRRQLVESIAQGKNAIALGAVTHEVMNFTRAGAPLETVTPREGTYVTAGNGAVMIIMGAPHPKAAKLLINWLLSKEGQEIFAKSQDQQSAREDVSTEGMSSIVLRVPGVSYYNTEKEELLLAAPKEMQTAREIFGPLLK